MTLRIVAVLALTAAAASAETPPAPEVVVLKAARIFDGRGETAARDGVVIVEGGKIRAAGSGLAVPAGARVIDLGDATLLPGFIDAHTHLSGESSDNWYQEQVNSLRRGVPETAIRATEHAYRTLQAGFTTVRDVGSSDYVDVALRNTINAGVVPGPRMLVAGPAMVATGSYGPKGFSTEFRVPQGAKEEIGRASCRERV